MKKIIQIISIGVVLLSAVLVSCDSGGGDGSLLKPEAFKEAIDHTEGAIILDVRTAQEFAEGHLDDAVNVDWNAGEEAFAKQLQHVPKDKAVFVYCKAGGRSAGAVIKLEKMGFTNIKELKGGMMAWNSVFSGAVATPKAVGMSMQDFEAAIKTDKVVLVDFNAQWCGPCQKMKPFLHQMEKDLGDKLKIVYVDTDKNPTLAQLFKIEALPTLMIYKDGVKQWEHIGFQDKENLEKQIQNYY